MGCYLTLSVSCGTMNRCNALCITIFCVDCCQLGVKGIIMLSKKKIERLLLQAKSRVLNAAPNRKQKAKKKNTLKMNGVSPSEVLNLELNLDHEVVRGTYLCPEWIEHHGGKLVASINEFDKVITPVDLFRNIKVEGTRSKVTNFVRANPFQYRRFLIKKLAPLKGVVKGVVVTLDWTPSMRQLIYVCKELGIPTILIPHEGVFADRHKFYLDESNGSDYPICDRAFVWGDLHESVFLERGYDKGNIVKVGSVKLDQYNDYQPQISKRDFLNLYGFDSAKKVIIFVVQPLDSQYSTNLARQAQRQVISDLFDYALDNDCQVIVRCPPSGDKIINDELLTRVAESELLNYDEYPFYLVEPEDAIVHSDLVLSINSTMLLEAALAGVPSISTKYVEFESLWDNIGIPMATCKSELYDCISRYIGTAKASCTDDGIEWAASSFSLGKFDGKSLERVINAIKDVDFGESSDVCDRIREGLHVGTVALNNPLVEKTRHIPAMLNARAVICPTNVNSAQRVDVFFKWGIGSTGSKNRQSKLAFLTGKPIMVIEDGFLRSKNIGLSGEAALSVILDSKTAYYDASTQSELELLIASDRVLTSDEAVRASSLISSIKTKRISKYNHAPDIEVNVGLKNDKVLVIDQRFGDMSVSKGLADELVFEDMLRAAVRDNPTSDILVKRHPDATIGGKSSYLTDEMITKVSTGVDNVHLIDFEVNPHALFDKCKKVYVVTSGMGFEALLRGCEVHVFGVPFYSHWGLTVDYASMPRRVRSRALEDVFYFSYVQQSRYVNPLTGLRGEIEDVIAYLSE
ncbi:conserved hypothetical protein [Vibrio chagasii]|nr:conserved hypothetical protein [Vibrio chagasii]